MYNRIPKNKNESKNSYYRFLIGFLGPATTEEGRCKFEFAGQGAGETIDAANPPKTG